jgi:hypothetical protein
MKKYSSILALVLLLPLMSAFAQNRETRNVATFTKVSLRIPAKLYIKQGSANKVELEGKKDLLKEIETEVEGSKLVIKKEGNWHNWNSDDGDINVYIVVKDLEALSLSGSGKAIGEGKFVVENLDLDVSGSGSLKLDAEASGRIEAEVSGSGDMELKGKCENFSSEITGSGSIDLGITVKNAAEFEVSGSGKTRVSGSASTAKAGISGSGKILASEFEVTRCDVNITGSGDVEINVKEALDADINGSGTVLYKGNPTKVNGSSSGSGKVRKM